jgi:acyl carrier protein
MTGVGERLAALVRQIMANEAVLPESLPDHVQLSELGVSSLKMVNLMLAIEAEFDLSIPPAAITPENFHSLATIEALIVRIQRGETA